MGEDVIGTRGENGGFTIIELMLGIVVAGILLAIAVPSFQNVIASNALRSTTSDLITALNTARSQAVSSRREVTLKPLGSSADWSDGWELDYDSSTDNAWKEKQTFVTKQGVTVTVTTPSGLTELKFHPSGHVGDTEGEFIFRICDDRTAETGREVIIGRFGDLQNKTKGCS